MSLTDIRSPNLSHSRQVRKRMVESEAGIVVAHNRTAAAIGAAVLRDGGNAMDAAIATSFAVGVLEPWMSGIGGVGALLVHTPDGQVSAMDAGARAPATLDPKDFPLVEGHDADLFGWPNVQDDRNVIGARSICVPGLVAGLDLAHRAHGRLPWSQLVRPAAQQAAAGLVVDFHSSQWIAHEADRLRRNAACRDCFMPQGRLPLTPAAASGRQTRLPMPVLARTLSAIAEHGAQTLYHGPLAESLAEDVAALGGYLSAQDLATYQPALGPAQTAHYRGHTLHLVPELNGAITVAMALRHCEQHHRPGAGPDTATHLAYADALAAAWSHRLSQLGDGAEQTLPSCTSHLSVVDRDGMMVTLTQTLLSSFGSGVVSPQTGILLNNGINWFDPRPGRVNGIAPGQRALANYAPMLMCRDGGDDVIGIGGSGGRKIIPAVFQGLAHIADFGMDLEHSIAAPRLDLSAPPTLVADGDLPQATLLALAEQHPTVIASRIESPNHFAILSAVRRQGQRNQGYTEPHHVWTDAVAETDPSLP